jgi:hypothetical protein
VTRERNVVGVRGSSVVTSSLARLNFLETKNRDPNEIDYLQFPAQCFPVSNINYKSIAQSRSQSVDWLLIHRTLAGANLGYATLLVPVLCRTWQEDG